MRASSQYDFVTFVIRWVLFHIQYGKYFLMIKTNICCVGGYITIGLTKKTNEKVQLYPTSLKYSIYIVKHK